MSANTKNRRRLSGRAVIAVGAIIGTTFITITLAAVAWLAIQGQSETGGFGEFGSAFAHLGPVTFTLINVVLTVLLVRASARLVMLEAALRERLESLAKGELE